MHPLEAFTNTVNLDYNCTKFGNLALYGIGYQSTREKLLERIEQIPKIAKLVVMHNAFQHLLCFEDAWAGQITDLAKDKYYLVGDVYTRKATIVSDQTWLALRTLVSGTR